MIRYTIYVLLGVVAFIGLIWLGLPRALNLAGLHPHYAVPDMDLSGRRALVVTTSHDTLGDSGKATGVWASEMTAPYYVFLDAGMNVDIASIQGGPIPIEANSLRWPVMSRYERRYLADPDAKVKVEDSLSIDKIDITKYDIVFLSGGWGAAYDFAQSDRLGEQITLAYASGAVVGGVCHGPLGLLKAKAPDGSLLVEGKRVSGATDKQIEQLGIEITPKHPERDLRAAGGVFESKTAFLDMFANHVVVDGRIVTGQNQNGGAETAHRMMEVEMSLGAPAPS